MNQDQFKRAYGESRNGVNNFLFNKLYPKVWYSNGVQELAESGCYWLLDIIGTELPKAYLAKPPAQRHPCIIQVRVTGSMAHIVGEFIDDDPNPYTKYVPMVDLPEGKWNLYMTLEDEGHFTLILPTER